MEYRGRLYSIVHGTQLDVWMWTAELDENTIKSGEAKTRASALTGVVMAIDKALAIKNAGLVAPH